MAEIGVPPESLLEALLELASQAELEVRILSSAGRGVDLAPRGSSAGRVGERVWVVLSPDDPVGHQARVVADALARFRAEFLEESFVAPAIREFIEQDSSA